MEEFSILDCEILWNAENKIPKSHMNAIKENLKTMSTQIKNAMKFTSDNREGIVTFALNPKIKNQKYEFFYNLHISVVDEKSEQPIWEVSVRGGKTMTDNSYVADIYNEKFRIYPALTDEDIPHIGFRNNS